jgi:hypothetical protein
MATRQQRLDDFDSEGDPPGRGADGIALRRSQWHLRDSFSLPIMRTIQERMMEHVQL